jgi:hypothetical protein
MRFHHVGYATLNIDRYFEDFFRPSSRRSRKLIMSTEIQEWAPGGPNKAG